MEERLGGDNQNEEEDEENYEINEGRYNTALRKSACYALQQFSKVLQEETLKELFPVLEKALALQWQMDTLP